MSDATQYRRLIAVDTDVVEANCSALRELHADKALWVSPTRRSNERFLVDGAEILARFAVRIAVAKPRDVVELAMHELLGSVESARHAVSLRSHVYSLRTVPAGAGVSYGATYVAPTERLVALAPIGFADGLDRKLSGALRVTVGGVDCPVIGRIAMDSISIDVTNVSEVHLGSEVVVYGEAGSSTFTANDAAESLGVTRAEILSRLSERAEVMWL